MRVVLSTGNHGEGWTRTDGAALTQILGWTKANKLVAVLEVHDSTGYGTENPTPLILIPLSIIG